MLTRTVNLVNRSLTGKQKLASIPIAQRPLYIQKMQQMKQIEQTPSHSFQSRFSQESTFLYEGHQLHYYSIQNSVQPQAIVIFMHGLNMHSQSFSYLGTEVAKHIKNLNYYAFDQMNFGKSTGPFRGEIYSLQDSVAQSLQFSEVLLKRFKKKPKIFLAGHSYGGVMAAKMSIMNPLEYAGVIFLAPALRIMPTCDNICVKMLIKALDIMIPRVRLFKYPTNSSTKYNLSEKINRDPEKYKGGVVPRSLKSILQAFQYANNNCAQFKSPFLGIGAGVQKAMDPFGLLDFQQKCSSPDKQVIYFENMWHAVNEQEEYGQITQIIIDWLKARI